MGVMGESRSAILFRMVREEPCLRSCLNRISNSCCQNHAVFEEDGRKVNATLHRHMNQQMGTFFRDAVEIAFACGFVPYFVRTRNGLPHLKVLPLGSFTWTIEQSKDRRDIGPLIYKVRCKSGFVEERDIHVLDFVSPRQLDSAIDEAAHSPLAHILNLFMIREQQLAQINESNAWNSNKHIAVTEKIDLKDPTTSGLQLLDELRRYNLSGMHSNMSENSTRLRTNRNESIAPANEGTFAWLDSVFHRNATKAAEVHLMPPNTEITELGAMDTNQFVDYSHNLYTNAVYTFFDMPGHSDLAGSRATGSSEQMSRHQHMAINSVLLFLQKLGEEAYAVAFKTDPARIVCKMTPITRMEIRDMADLKTLFEIGVITPHDSSRMRSNYLE